MSARGTLAAVVAVLGCLPATACAAPARSLGIGEAAFWDGPADGDACGERCWRYPLEVREPAWRLRVGIDHATVGDVWTARLLDPAGAQRDSFTPGSGLYSNEGFANEPGPGRWTVEVTAAPEVRDLRFRLRAKLERQPRPAAVPEAVLPNLQALPPYDFTFSYPVTNGSTDGAPTGIAFPGGRISCHPEEIAEEGAQRCLRMAFGVRNTGQGPMELLYDAPASLADAVLMQRVRWSDETHRDRVAGVAKYHKTHGHYHHDKAIGLDLLKVIDPARGGLEPAAPTHLKGFAHRNELLREWRVFYPTWDEGTGFGLLPGWGDYYEWDRPGNYIDFGLNGDGRYVLRIVADPVAGIAESNEADNASYTMIDVTGEKVTWLESGRGRDPWDPCKILMPMGAEPGDPAAGQPPRPASCQPDTVDVAAPAVAAAPAKPAAARPKPKAKRKASRRSCRRHKTRRKRAACERRAKARRRAAARKRASRGRG